MGFSKDLNIPFAGGGVTHKMCQLIKCRNAEIPEAELRWQQAGRKANNQNIKLPAICSKVIEGLHPNAAKPFALFVLLPWRVSNKILYHFLFVTPLLCLFFYFV